MRERVVDAVALQLSATEARPGRIPEAREESLRVLFMRQLAMLLPGEEIPGDDDRHRE